MNTNNDEKMLEEWYYSRMDEIDEKIKETINKSNEKLNKLLIEKKNVKNNENLIDIMEEKFNIQLVDTCKEVYKQGFKDAVRLINECYVD